MYIDRCTEEKERLYTRSMACACNCAWIMLETSITNVGISEFLRNASPIRSGREAFCLTT